MLRGEIKVGCDKTELVEGEVSVVECIEDEEGLDASGDVEKIERSCAVNASSLYFGVCNTRRPDRKTRSEIGGDVYKGRYVAAKRSDEGGTRAVVVK